VTRFGIVRSLRARKGPRLPKRPIDISKWDLSAVPDEVIIAEAGRRRRAMAANRPKVMHPCKHCGKLFGAAEVRKHWPVCPKNRKNLKKKGGA
jgi:hypothetical protein